jgi:hypothetical protein
MLEDPIDDGDYLTFNVVCSSVNEIPLSGTAILIGILI